PRSTTPATKKKRNIATKAISTAEAPRSLIEALRRSLIDDHPKDRARLLRFELHLVEEGGQDGDWRLEVFGDDHSYPIAGRHGVGRRRLTALTVGIDGCALPIVEEDGDVMISQGRHHGAFPRYG